METYTDQEFEDAYRAILLRVGYNSTNAPSNDGIEIGRTFSETLDKLIESK